VTKDRNVRDRSDHTPSEHTLMHTATHNAKTTHFHKIFPKIIQKKCLDWRTYTELYDK